VRLSVVIALAACAPDRGPRARPASPDALHLAFKDQIKSLDPTFANDEFSSVAVHALYDTLVGYEPASPDDPRAGLRLAPRLADRWDVSPDATRYTFHLRAGIVYADGTPIAASDFAFALERALATPDTPFGAYLADVVGADAVAKHAAPHAAGIVANDDARELVIALARPSVVLPHVLALPFAAPQRAGREPIASGPYEVEAWSQGERLVLRANPRHWDRRRGRIPRIEIRENLPRDTQFLAFERGELDALDHLNAPDLQWIAVQPAWRPYIASHAALMAFGSRMNVRVPPFDDRRVRQALNLALDKSHVAKLLAGAAVPSHGILPPGLPGRDDALAPYPHDPARARRLLADAGYPNGFAVEYATFDDDEAIKLAQSLQRDLADVGVRVRITTLTYATWLVASQSPTGPAFSITNWGADYADATTFLDPRFHSRSIADAASQNDSFYANAELDALLDRARAEPDAGARAALYRRAERILFDDAPWLWGYHQLVTEVVQPYVRGYVPHPLWDHDFTYARIEVAP
jgi:ABC-type transport system substrate-binding protein